jgi:hypothetical protein
MVGTSKPSKNNIKVIVYINYIEYYIHGIIQTPATPQTSHHPTTSLLR